MRNSHKLGIVHRHVWGPEGILAKSTCCLDFWGSKFGNHLWLLAVLGAQHCFQGVQSQEAVSQWEEAPVCRWLGVQFTVLLWLFPSEIWLAPKKSCEHVYPSGFRPFAGERKSRRASTTRPGWEGGDFFLEIPGENWDFNQNVQIELSKDVKSKDFTKRIMEMLAKKCEDEISYLEHLSSARSC